MNNYRLAGFLTKKEIYKMIKTEIRNIKMNNLFLLLNNSRNYGEYYNLLLDDSHPSLIFIESIYYTKEYFLMHTNLKIFNEILKDDLKNNKLEEYKNILFSKNFDYFIEFLYNLYTVFRYSFNGLKKIIYWRICDEINSILDKLISSFFIEKNDEIKNEKLLKIIFLFLNNKN